MKRVKSFKDFLFESAKDIAGKYLNDELYPWDDKLIDAISKIDPLIAEIQSFNQRRGLSENQIGLNIKVYQTPDFAMLASDYERSEESVMSDYQLFLEDSLNWFIEDVEQLSWVKNVEVGGRSGGWLIIKFVFSVFDEYEIHDRIDNEVNDYNVFKEDYEFTEEEIEEYNSSKGMQMSYDLGLAELPEGMGEAIKLSNDSAILVQNEIVSRLQKMKNDLTDIKERIENFKNDSAKSFTQNYN